MLILPCTAPRRKPALLQLAKRRSLVWTRNTLRNPSYAQSDPLPHRTAHRNKPSRGSKDHGRSNKSTPPLGCPMCIFAPFDKSDFLSHLNREHQQDNCTSEEITKVGIVKCAKCKIFWTTQMGHSEETCVHPLEGQRQKNSSASSSCPLCKAECLCPLDLVSHMNERHSSDTVDSETYKLGVIIAGNSG